MSMMTPNLRIGRAWHGLYAEDGLGRFEAGGSVSRMSGADQDRLKAWVTAALPGSTRQIGAFIAAQFGFSYESRSGLIALLHRLGLEYHKPEIIPHKLDEHKQLAFIEAYEKLLNGLGDDEAVLFADAVHPTHAARPASCWAPAGDRLAIDPRIKSEETSGRQRPRRGQSGDRSDKDDRGAHHRRGLNHRPPAIHRGAAPGPDAHRCLPRPCPLSPFKAGAAMA
jgi:transposase